jgi:hypothetical protein
MLVAHDRRLHPHLTSILQMLVKGVDPFTQFLSWRRRGDRGWGLRSGRRRRRRLSPPFHGTSECVGSLED